MSKFFGNFPENYELLDAGASLKLENWGGIITIRPELQAYFQTGIPLSEWRKKAHWEFIPENQAGLKGVWKKLRPDASESWDFTTQGFTVKLEASGNKHIGVFPEQQYNWSFLEKQLHSGKRFLNLFAYTGASSLSGAQTGAEVTHVDSVRAMIDQARVNMELSGLSNIKWVVEDARKFVQRELKRDNKYDVIQLDPPAFGLGAKGEKWKLEDLLPQLLEECLGILNPGGHLIVSTYSPKLELKQLNSMIRALPGIASSNAVELWLKAITGKELFYGLVAHIQKRK